MQEIWKEIPGYEGRYFVSTWGNVKNQNGALMKPFTNEKGYLKVQLKIYGKKKNLRVNRLVAEAFLPNPYNLPQVNHRDGNKQNNSVTNLEWCTNQQNNEHAQRLKSGEYYF